MTTQETQELKAVNEVNYLEDKWSDALRDGCQPADKNPLVTAKNRLVITAFLQENLVDDYTNIDHLGVPRTKAEDLINCGDGLYVVEKLSKPVKKPRAYDDKCVVVVGTDEVQATFNGKNVSGKFIWTDTWVKFGTQWKCVASHGSKLSD
jgi:hypothetical protein